MCYRLMNRFLGFLKQKFSEVKEQNQQELQNILSALDYEPYSHTKMLSLLQQIKTNYLEWNILIANEASTGLYYSQLHNRTSALKKARNAPENEVRTQRNGLVAGQMQRTLQDLQAMEKLSGAWVVRMNDCVERMDGVLSAERRRGEERRHSESAVLNLQAAQSQIEFSVTSQHLKDIRKQSSEEDTEQPLTNELIQNISTHIPEQRPL